MRGSLLLCAACSPLDRELEAPLVYEALFEGLAVGEVWLDVDEALLDTAGSGWTTAMSGGGLHEEDFDSLEEELPTLSKRAFEDLVRVSARGGALDAPLPPAPPADAETVHVSVSRVGFAPRSEAAVAVELQWVCVLWDTDEFSVCVEEAVHALSRRGGGEWAHDGAAVYDSEIWAVGGSSTSYR